MKDDRLYFEYLIDIIKNPKEVYPCSAGKRSLYIGEVKNKKLAFVIAEKIGNEITLIADCGWMK